MESGKPYSIKSVSEFHRLRGLPKPEHPLISVVNVQDITSADIYINHFILHFYCISLKRIAGVNYKYGQQDYDFDNGAMFFMAPNQVMGFTLGENAISASGWMLLIHPDFLWNTALSNMMEKHEFFDYSVMVSKGFTKINGHQ
jgi:hypothetical protein